MSPEARRPRKPAAKPPTPLLAEVIIVTHNAGAEIGPADVDDSVAVELKLNRSLPAGVELTRVFGSANRLPEKLRGTASESGGAELLNFFAVTDVGDDPAALAESLLANPNVEAAYVKPAVELPKAPDQAPGINEQLPSTEPPPPATPDFTAQQGYLDAAPTGINARWAWTRAGGGGQSVRVIDIEGAWRFSHEDLLQNQGGVIAGAQIAGVDWRNHGTAVVGEIGGDRNTFGITGIAPDANIRAVSHSIVGGSAAAIRTAADALGAGDILLLEMHRPGPRNNFAQRADQNGYIAVEWWPDDFAAIRYALGRGVIVVEAAGNGAQDLDDALYNTRPAGFPTTWSNPFRSGGPDSGAIVVGAGAPPSGAFGTARSRLDFSNWGTRVDAQGWGRQVVTTGYGDLQGGMNEDLWYTSRFSGTSSASPIVVGAVAAYQGISAAGSGRKTSAQVRARLRATGSAQTDTPGRPATQRIGNLPDIQAMVGPVIKIKDIKDVKAEKIEFKEFVKETKELKREKIELKEYKREKVELKDGKREVKEFKNEKLEVEVERKIPDIDVKIREVDIDVKTREVIDVDIRRQLVVDELRERVGLGRLQPSAPAAADADARIDAIEQVLAELGHFITQAYRPDLGDGALGYDLDAQSAAAKDEKDLKDLEKLAEG